MKFVELKDKSKEQLLTTLKELKKEALNLRFQKAVGELANTARIKQVRRDVARVKTALNKH